MVAPTPRPALAGIPVYRAGRPAADPASKLSSNELPFDPLPGVLDRAVAELRHVNRYPDAGCTALTTALAGHHEVDPDRIAIGTGSVAVLYALLSAFCGPGDEVVLPWRSFEAYPIAVELTGAAGVRVPVGADGTHDLAGMAAAITPRTRAVLVCTPNNPTGPVVTADELASLVAAVPPSVLLVVDEAYVEFVTDPAAASGPDWLDRENVVVLRTFSKAHGLAALRVGYALAHAPVAEAVRKVLPPFGVSDVAQAAAIASLESLDAMGERVAAVVAERDAVVAGLRGQGWDVPQAQGNFVWLPLGAEAVEFAAAAQPLSVRAFAGEGVRVTIGLPEVNEQFLATTRRWRTGS
ncbi:histidinol-phosphate transaminase [Aeromicrobium marinum]|nr:histidinol-phosphate transaminase [Aeromicrobium marinum]